MVGLTVLLSDCLTPNKANQLGEEKSQICGVSIFLFCRNYPSWLFVESGTNSSSDDVGLDDDRECQGEEIVVVECTTAAPEDQGDSDSEDEGWYSLSR